MSHKDEPGSLSSRKLAVRPCTNFALLAPSMFSFLSTHPSLCWLSEMTVSYLCLLHTSLAQVSNYLCVSSLRTYLICPCCQMGICFRNFLKIEICMKSVLCKDLSMKNFSPEISLALLSRSWLLDVSSHRKRKDMCIKVPYRSLIFYVIIFLFQFVTSPFFFTWVNLLFTQHIINEYAVQIYLEKYFITTNRNDKISLPKICFWYIFTFPFTAYS